MFLVMVGVGMIMILRGRGERERGMKRDGKEKKQERSKSHCKIAKTSSLHTALGPLVLSPHQSTCFTIDSCMKEMLAF